MDKVELRRERDKLRLEIALAEGTLVQRVLMGVVGLVFWQPEDMPEHLQADLLGSRN